MKVVYIGVFKNDSDTARELTSERKLTTYNYFTQSTISQFMTFTGATIAKRTTPNQRLDVEEKDHMFHAFAHPTESICGIVITDIEYPKLVAHSLLKKVVEQFVTKYPRTAYANFTEGSPQLQMPELKDYMQKYQDPNQADSILKIQKELDETKIVMKQTIESVLERGEKIDDLVAKSDGLSAQSKMFYTQAKKQNSCCIVM